MLPAKQAKPWDSFVIILTEGKAVNGSQTKLVKHLHVIAVSSIRDEILNQDFALKS